MRRLLLHGHHLLVVVVLLVIRVARGGVLVVLVAGHRHLHVAVVFVVVVILRALVVGGVVVAAELFALAFPVEGGVVDLLAPFVGGGGASPASALDDGAGVDTVEVLLAFFLFANFGDFGRVGSKGEARVCEDLLEQFGPPGVVFALHEDVLVRQASLLALVTELGDHAGDGRGRLLGLGWLRGGFGLGLFGLGCFFLHFFLWDVVVVRVGGHVVVVVGGLVGAVGARVIVGVVVVSLLFRYVAAHRGDLVVVV